ncbi:MAG: prepilin-type N-terminal cleavage/methylation domain-containing protein [Candidatus Omnitrophica bacterium]|nr:prepilin-type N-terminal cleavage/methylation domain-containing protein [Candidatus Omnitrophota bacterium]MDD5488387.1 prepilin-type N-terminal cleavage/methylation domain-containing protein [Candidatus Omnitrophota bacterium]
MDKRGMTLAEVVVSMAIVTLLTVAFIGAMSQSISYSEKSDSVYIASIIAQRRLDVLKKFDFSDLPSAAPETAVSQDFDGNGTVDYYRTTEITENYNGYADLIKIKVSVDRVDEGEASGNPVIMETLIAENPDQ